MKEFTTVNNFSQQFPDSPETHLNSTGPALLVTTLAWAVQNSIPLHQAVLSLTPYGKVSKRYSLYLFAPKKWKVALDLTYLDLLDGKPLHLTLRDRMCRFLPEYFINAVETAENENRLETVLPHFAKRIDFLACLKTNFKRALILPTTVLIVSAMICTLFSLFIVPKFVRIGEELLAGSNDAWGMSYLSFVSETIRHHFFEVILIFAFFVFIYKVAKKPLFWLFDLTMTYVPFFSSILKDLAVLEFSASMGSYLSAGEDILQAAKFSRKACRFHWMRGKLKRFIAEMEKGTPWLDAWAMQQSQTV